MTILKSVTKLEFAVLHFVKNNIWHYVATNTLKINLAKLARLFLEAKQRLIIIMLQSIIEIEKNKLQSRLDAVD